MFGNRARKPFLGLQTRTKELAKKKDLVRFPTWHPEEVPFPSGEFTLP